MRTPNLRQRRIIASLKQLQQSTNKLLLARYTRKWVEETTYLHIFNYWYYRYFTNQFELFLLRQLP